MQLTLSEAFSKFLLYERSNRSVSDTILAREGITYWHLQNLLDLGLIYRSCQKGFYRTQRIIEARGKWRKNKCKTA